MKKWLLCGATLLMLSPTAAYAQHEETKSVINPVVANSTVTTWEQFTKELIKKINSFETDINITYTGPMDDFKKEIMAAFDQAKKQAVYASGHMESTTISADSLGNVSYKIKYLTNQTQEAAVQKKMGQVLKNIIKPTMTEFDKVKAINDYIVSNTSYGTKTKASPHSAYALLFEGQAVCQGYALAAQAMLSQSGIETKYVVGFVNGNEAHAWNLVKVDGKWYHLDTTWNDPLPNRIGASSYDYFLVTDEVLKKDHSWIQADYPAATSTKYSFMRNVHFAYPLNNVVYFSNTADHDKLYKLEMATGKKTKVLDKRALYITGVGQNLYYSDYSNSGYLTKLNLKTLKAEVLVKQPVTNLKISDNYLIYNMNAKEHKLTLSQ
ncbi:MULTISPECIES: transglutaminase domain-containing protein [Lysinibacillus]|jgi:transglutaminase/protease-like cytokinesis protein 3|uniref:transglutaminase domain-containing protein n=1 Tax=Lysinibacillus TaxID=400634 RepID=UPI0004D8B92C|nr:MULTISPECIES: transglutaminase domain-containing protein [Lysinibacillus]AJK89827.1 protease [Lysinibacillus fusiformis]KGA81744.1 protease [Lysinibacillus fusiformis]KHK51736.1 protease [Lysinibacillus sp. A1]